VYFDVIAPWSSPERETAPELSTRGRIVQRAVLSVVIALFTLALVLAWRNWRFDAPTRTAREDLAHSFSA
jgi:hypothetical protein